MDCQGVQVGCRIVVAPAYNTGAFISISNPQSPIPPMHPLDDTIVAIASPPGGAARGIVRMSGPQVRTCIEAVFRMEDNAEPPHCTTPTVVAGSIRLDGIASELPCDLYLWPNRKSYTGGPVAEIHTLGSRPLLEALLRTLCTVGARLAEPGEFTLRAFLAGKVDLTQAEAVLGVINAADPHQLDVALAQLAGGLARPLHELRESLISLLAHLEAGFDFAEEDLPFITTEQLDEQLADAERAVAKLVEQTASRSETSAEIRVVIVGLPNAGKSSLFNTLARDADALVSEHPGTTRDYLTAELDFDGVKCQLVDTAGMVTKNTSGSIEEAARAASVQQSRLADVQIVCLDSTDSPGDRPADQFGVNGGVVRIVVLTKIDLPNGCDVPGAILTSGVTGEGLDELRGAIRRTVLATVKSGAEVVVGTAARCRESLRMADASLNRARQIVASDGGEELVAAEIRVALDELGKVVGAVYTDDVLDRIFSRFCIGK